VGLIGALVAGIIVAEKIDLVVLMVLLVDIVVE
jgi:hypothetical protein